MLLIWFAAGAIILAALVILEGKRQEKIYGRSERGTMMRVGMLELQKHLQPDRRVEILLEKQHDPDAGQSGDPPSELDSSEPGNEGGMS